MTLQPLPEQAQQRGGDPALVGEELRHLIAEHIDRHPRSLQTRIGPSELGTPCSRRLGYKLAGTPETNVRSGAWRPTVGTAVHAWLEQAMEAWNALHGDQPRFYLEERVTVGQVGGTDIDGSCDLYDRVTATVVDWKIVGPDRIRRYRIDGPGEQYRSQVHLYGKGFADTGLPVDTVAIFFLPQNGELRDGHYWHEPYDPAVAEQTLLRANGVASLVAQLGQAAPALLPTADTYCSYCPWHRQGSTDLAAACPGDASRQARTHAPVTLADALHNQTGTAA